MIKKNDIITVTITDINNLGYGVARHEGEVVFVRGGVTEDVLEARIIKSAKNYSVAITERLITPSRHRVEPDCKTSARCGGCTFRHVSYEYELELKKGYVKSAFAKAGVAAEILPDVLHAGAYGYRNKVQYPVSPTGEIGYYAKHSHTIIPCDDCLLQNPAFDPILEAVKRYIKEYSVSEVRHVYLRIAVGTGEIMVCLVSRKPKLPHEAELVSMLCEASPAVCSISVNLNDRDTNVILGDSIRIIYEKDFIEDVLCGLRFKISPLSFYQVNHDCAELLYKEALRRVLPHSPRRLADLYCGSGTIGIYFASQIANASVYGLEISPSATANARDNAEANGITNAQFICADAAEAELDSIDCVIVDPPRKGCSQKLIEKIASCGIKTICYISCNPDTLARDAAELLRLGYKMDNVSVADMFPRTGAIEAVTLFSKNTTL